MVNGFGIIMFLLATFGKHPTDGKLILDNNSRGTFRVTVSVEIKGDLNAVSVETTENIEVIVDGNWTVNNIYLKGKNVTIKNKVNDIKIKGVSNILCESFVVESSSEPLEVKGTRGQLFIKTSKPPSINRNIQSSGDGSLSFLP